jgi:hypothetical protein
MKKQMQLAALLFAWYVTTYSGQIVAGPFTGLSECTEVAREMAERYQNVSAVCRNR